MRLAVLDTNVVISAGIRPDSPPALLMDRLLEGEFQIVTSPWVIAEYREVARRPKFRRYGFPPLWLEFVLDESLRLPEPPAWPYPLPDAKDSPFLALAHKAGAWLVTGNMKHFPATARNGVTVISPAEYLKYLETPR